MSFFPGLRYSPHDTSHAAAEEMTAFFDRGRLRVERDDRLVAARVAAVAIEDKDGDLLDVSTGLFTEKGREWAAAFSARWERENPT